VIPLPKKWVPNNVARFGREVRVLCHAIHFAIHNAAIFYQQHSGSSTPEKFRSHHAATDGVFERVATPMLKIAWFPAGILSRLATIL